MRTALGEDPYRALARSFPLLPLRSGENLERAFSVAETLAVRHDLSDAEERYLADLGDLIERYLAELGLSGVVAPALRRVAAVDSPSRFPSRSWCDAAHRSDF